MRNLQRFKFEPLSYVPKLRSELMTSDSEGQSSHRNIPFVCRDGKKGLYLKLVSALGQASATKTKFET